MDTATRSNQELYNLVAPYYEEADGRRAVAPDYLLKNLGQFKYTGLFEKVLLVEEKILDIGSGTGYWMGKGGKPLKNVVAYDISENMLKEIKAGCLKVCGDAHKLPFKEGVFDKVICISTLHHLSDTGSVLYEIKRVLRRGGIFYSDLDLDLTFARRFRIPLAVYRWFRNAPGRFKVSKELYKAAEAKNQGINGELVGICLEELGFKVTLTYHWGNGQSRPEGRAPYVSIWGVK